MRNVQAKKSGLDGSNAFVGVIQFVYHILLDQPTEMCFCKSLERGEDTPLSKSPDSIVSWVYRNQSLIAINHIKLQLLLQV